MRDIFEERTEVTEKYEAHKDKIQTAFVSLYRRKLADGIQKSLEYAGNQIEGMKQQFSDSFDELDRLITKKYEELEACANDQQMKEEELEKNRKILEWIEVNKKEMDEILDI